MNDNWSNGSSMLTKKTKQNNWNTSIEKLTQSNSVQIVAATGNPTEL
jgi:hypothetical protein